MVGCALDPGPRGQTCDPPWFWKLNSRVIQLERRATRQTTLSKEGFFFNLRIQTTRKGNAAYLNVVIERKFIRVRTQPDRIHLPFSLVVDVGCQHVFGEYIALQQELMVPFQCLQSFVE